MISLYYYEDSPKAINGSTEIARRTDTKPPMGPIASKAAMANITELPENWMGTTGGMPAASPSVINPPRITPKAQ